MATELPQHVYDELRRLAAGFLRHERRDHTLQATALLHEVILKLQSRLSSTELSRQDLVAASAEAMRRILVDHARSRNRLKRAGSSRAIRGDVDLLGIPAREGMSPDLLDLHAALDELKVVDAESARMVELRFFAGLSVEEAAMTMSISPRSAARMWAFARAWLYDRLTKTK